MNNNEISYTKKSGGRPSMYAEPTEDVSVRVPASLLEFIKNNTDFGKAPGIREFAIRYAASRGYDPAQT